MRDDDTFRVTVFVTQMTFGWRAHEYHSYPSTWNFSLQHALPNVRFFLNMRTWVRFHCPLRESECEKKRTDFVNVGDWVCTQDSRAKHDLSRHSAAPNGTITLSPFHRHHDQDVAIKCHFPAYNCRSPPSLCCPANF